MLPQTLKTNWHQIDIDRNYYHEGSWRRSGNGVLPEKCLALTYKSLECDPAERSLLLYNKSGIGWSPSSHMAKAVGQFFHISDALDILRNATTPIFIKRTG